LVLAWIEPDDRTSAAVDRIARQLNRDRAVHDLDHCALAHMVIAELLTTLQVDDDDLTLGRGEQDSWHLMPRRRNPRSIGPRMTILALSGRSRQRR